MLIQILLIILFGLTFNLCKITKHTSLSKLFMWPFRERATTLHDRLHPNFFDRCWFWQLSPSKSILISTVSAVSSFVCLFPLGQTMYPNERVHSCYLLIVPCGSVNYSFCITKWGGCIIKFWNRDFFGGWPVAQFWKALATARRVKNKLRM